MNVAFKLGEELNNRKVEYILYNKMWTNFNYPTINLSFANWTAIKYLNSTGSAFTKTINTIPNNTGGLYLFFIKCNVITGITEYPFYIGRAQYSKTQNLRKRVKEYFQKYSKNDERPMIYRMFEYWSKDLYVAYYPLKTNKSIISIEKDIINSLLLPMNDQIPDTNIRKAVKAFSK